jgi:hypothetical protein
MTVSDETLGAYVDGELDASERAKVAAALAADAEIARRVERMKMLRNRLQSAFSGAANEPVPQHLLEALQKQPTSEGVVDFAQARAAKQRPARRWTWPELGSIAASLFVCTLLGYFLLRTPDGDFLREESDALLARGALAAALSNQLASEQSRDALVRIGISFQDKSGDYCRTFAFRDQVGLACRDAGQWAVQTLARAAPVAGDATPAGSALPPEVLHAIEARIAGEPLDAAGEAAARQSNWEGR